MDTTNDIHINNMKPPSATDYKPNYKLLLLTAVSILVFSCNNDPKSANQESAKKPVGQTIQGKSFSKEEITNVLKNMVAPVDTLDSSFVKRKSQLKNAKEYTYLMNGYQPLWMEEGGITQAAVQLIGELDSLRIEGLKPERYGQQKLAALMDKIKQGSASVQEVAGFDTACTAAYLQASHHLLMGMIKPSSVDDQWFHTNDTNWNGVGALATTLSQQGKYTSLNEYKSALPTYSLLRNEYRRYNGFSNNEGLRSLKQSIAGREVKDSVLLEIVKQEMPWLQADGADIIPHIKQMIRGFQDYSGLTPTGRMDSTTARYLARNPDSMLEMLSANMERLRWLPRTLEDQYVLVNIPLMELYYKKGGENAFHMKVVVGKPSRQTPSFNANMANVVFSPPWGVPPTILKKEVLPGIASKGGAYLARRGLKAYNRKGKIVNVSGMSAGSLRGLSFRQAPGARNALGEVKFNLPNKWDIYLHDTPHKEDFPRRNRARSSGCVRVERPKDFAEFILATIEGRDFNQTIIDSIIQTRRTRFEQLTTKIPVHLVYLTAFEDSTGLRMKLLPDIYKRDEKLIMAITGRKKVVADTTKTLAANTVGAVR